MEKKKLNSLTARIKKDMSGLSAMGAMMLTFEFDTMENSEKIALRDHLAGKGISYDLLNQRIKEV